MTCATGSYMTCATPFTCNTSSNSKFACQMGAGVQSLASPLPNEAFGRWVRVLKNPNLGSELKGLRGVFLEIYCSFWGMRRDRKGFRGGDFISPILLWKRLLMARAYCVGPNDISI